MGVRRMGSVRAATLCAVVTVAVLLGGPGPAAVAAPRSEVTRWTGETLTAEDAWWEGCILFSYSVIVYRADDDVDYVRYTEGGPNYCTDESTIKEGVAEVTDLEIGRSLGSAHLTASVPLRERGTIDGVYVDRDAGTIDLNLTWTATSKLLRESSRSVYHVPGVYKHIHSFRGMYREAAVTGTLETLDGRIERATFADLVVMHY